MKNSAAKINLDCLSLFTIMTLYPNPQTMMPLRYCSLFWNQKSNYLKVELSFRVGQLIKIFGEKDEDGNMAKMVARMVHVAA